jgi:hypothetical protein
LELKNENIHTKRNRIGKLCFIQHREAARARAWIEWLPRCGQSAANPLQRGQSIGMAETRWLAITLKSLGKNNYPALTPQTPRL